MFEILGLTLLRNDNLILVTAVSLKKQVSILQLATENFQYFLKVKVFPLN